MRNLLCFAYISRHNHWDGNYACSVWWHVVCHRHLKLALGSNKVADPCSCLMYFLNLDKHLGLTIASSSVCIVPVYLFLCNGIFFHDVYWFRDHYAHVDQGVGNLFFFEAVFLLRLWNCGYHICAASAHLKRYSLILTTSFYYMN